VEEQGAAQEEEVEEVGAGVGTQILAQ